jgi:probable rRNA maturation factor
MNRICVSVLEQLQAPEWISEIEGFVQKILENQKKDGWELSVLFCNDDFIQNLNKDFREIDSPTDILSFEDGTEYEDEEGAWYSAGDIAISLETFAKNAEEFGVSLDNELKRLLIHGVLHLSGMDHGEAHIAKDRTFEGGTSEDKKMLELQEELLLLLDNKIIIK